MLFIYLKHNMCKFKATNIISMANQKQCYYKIIRFGQCFNILYVFVCSAGVGRTGVFITLSIVLERMRYEGVVDMFQTVKMLRTQRPAMVQTEVN